MPSFWQQIPFLRVLISFLTGIILADYANFTLSNALIICILTLTSQAALYYFGKTLTSILQNGILQLILFIPLGILCFNLQKDHFRHHHFSQTKYDALLVQTEQKAQKSKRGWKAEASVIAGFLRDGTYIKCKGKIILISDSNDFFFLDYGNQLLIKSGIQEIVSKQNPGAFNYQKFMANKGVFHQCQISITNAQLYSVNNGNSILNKTYAAQNFIHHSLKKYLSGKNEIAIAEALLYGYDKEIDEEITEAYSKTGTLHILAVSGMHVGLIFMILSWFLSPINKLPKGRLWVSIFQFLGIWIYALLCGLSPSILRACVMFSFVILGKQINKSSNPFNSLSAAGFLLICIQPSMLYNVGFQLSFAAVAGILGFYPYLNLLIHFKNNFLNEIWKIIAVSVAAQTLTLPISFYYFHQFPSYFLPANLIIIPLSTFIIYGGILLLILSPISAAAEILGFIISKLILFTSKISIFIANLPYSSIENISWSIPQMAAYYLIGIALIYYFSTRNIFALKSIMFVLFTLSIFGLNQTFSEAKTNKLCIYLSKQDILFQVHVNQQLCIFTNTSEKSRLNKNYIQPYKYEFKIKKETWNALDSFNYIIQLNPKMNLLLVQQNGVISQKKADIALICGTKKINLKQLLEHNQIKQVVLHNRIPGYRRKKYKEILHKYSIPFHDISENGAFELSL